MYDRDGDSKKSITTLRKAEIVRTKTSRKFEALGPHHSLKGKCGDVEWSTRLM
jgi:hypothetical protein